MKLNELKQLDHEALSAHVKSLQEEVFRTRFQHATSQLQDSSKLAKTRRALAQAKTVLRLKELGK